MKYLLILLLFYIISTPLLGQENLRKLEALALENSPELKALEQEYLAALERGPQASALPDTRFDVGWFASEPETRLGPQYLRLGLTQLFPWRGKLKAKEKLAINIAEADYKQLEFSQLELVYGLKQAYFELYSLDKQRDIMEHNIHVHNAMENRVLIGIEAGNATVADALLVDLKQAALIKDIEILENSKQFYRTEINQLLNRTLNTEVIVDDTLLLANLYWNRTQLQEEITNNHPVLERFQLHQETARQAMEVNRLEAKPDFGLGLDYIFVGNRTDADPAGNGRDIFMPRASVYVPLSSKQYRAKNREETFRISALENHKEALLNQFMAKIDQAYTKHREAVLQLELVEEQLLILEGVIDVKEIAYSNQGIDFDDLLQLHHQMMELEMEKVKAVVKSHLAKAEIERYLMLN